MKRRPRITGKELVAALGRAGFAVVRTKGSHRRLRHPDGRVTTVSIHAGETIGPGLLAKILRDCEMTPDELEDLLE
jgi:predicted RNA binding protein YcfA (HicA-like mRNA interferase family)